ncbi:succinate dehydrogenase [ubiquinone] cytochrome b small subunit B, mitochondrial-like [Amphiura filiformis]|uniref:succinate dehydrogenase [ubiquinone] cytochrome b small subunit B, mitochondrial-like n=1 Tax=Amphiura filiformis TaxID=82378 RepID=UPI003B227299
MATNSLLRANRVLSLAPSLMGKTCLPCCSRTPMLVGSTKLHTSPQRHSGDGHGGMMGSTHWNIERAVIIGMMGLTPAALITHHPALDVALSAAFVVHGHWGLENIFTDYVYIHGKKIEKVASSMLFAVSCLTFAGLCNFNYNDVGVSKAITMFWS